MTDELEKLEKILRQTPVPEPGEEEKNAAISKALLAFEKNASISQENAFLKRLTYAARAAVKIISGRQDMKRTYVFAATTCLVVSAGIIGSGFIGTELNTSYMRVGGPVQKFSTIIPAQKPSGALLGKAESSYSHSKSVADMPPAALPSSPTSGEVASSVPSGSSEGAVIIQKPTADAMLDSRLYQYHDEGRDKFQNFKPSELKVTKNEPVSTFSVDVDTASYSFLRASLNNNALPQKDAVRIEELINYFPYEYETPANKEEPFKANVSVFPTPWNPETRLMHIGIKGYQIKEKPRSNLVFLIDTSGSMQEPNKLPLVQNSLKLLLSSLQPEDTVAIVTYAGSAGVSLQPTKVKYKDTIISALDNLGAGGGTAGAEGIKQAYRLAEANFDKEGVNRVILATDGDFNVGITDTNELKKFIEQKRESGIFLSVMGFGMGNYNDELMQALAQNGNGNAAYIDNLNEARKVLVEEAGSTLFTIAKDVKIQVEFNPAKVAEYRLVGYETRVLNREDFNNDKVDAGDIGAGHAVTAIYEITPVGSKARLVDELRYKTETKEESAAKGGEYAFVKIRYKLPEGKESKLITTPVDGKNESKEGKIPNEARFASAVAAFGQILKQDSHVKNFSYDDVVELALGAKGQDEFGYRAEFINLVRMAKSIATLPVQEK